MRTALIVSFSVCWMASAAFAQTGPAQRPPPPDAAAPPGGVAPGHKKGDSADKGGENPHGTDALGSCLAMWDPATHMTRREWSRACRRVADRLKNTSVK